MNTHENIKNAFEHIYANNVWGIGSGPGSYVTENYKYVDALTSLIKKHNIRTVLDYGCGDWQFSKTIDWSSLVDTYTGVDVVHPLIEHHKLNYSSSTVKFEDVTSDWKIPQVDLVICKDVFQHLPNDEVRSLLKQFKENSKFMLLVNDVTVDGDTSTPNVDCEIGGWRLLRLQDDPWNLVAEEVFYLRYVEIFVKEALLIKCQIE